MEILEKKTKKKIIFKFKQIICLFFKNFSVTPTRLRTILDDDFLNDGVEFQTEDQFNLDINGELADKPFIDGHKLICCFWSCLFAVYFYLFYFSFCFKSFLSLFIH